MEQSAIFDDDLKLAREVTLEEWKSRSAWDKLLDQGASLLRSQL